MFTCPCPACRALRTGAAILHRWWDADPTRGGCFLFALERFLFDRAPRPPLILSRSHTCLLWKGVRPRSFSVCLILIVLSSRLCASWHDYTCRALRRMRHFCQHLAALFGGLPRPLDSRVCTRMCARCVYCSYSGAPSAAALGGDVWCRAALLAMCGVNTPCLHLLPRCTTTLASCASTSGIPRASSNHGCHSGSATLHRRAPVVRLGLVQCRQHLAQPVTAHSTWSLRKQRP